MVDNVIWVGIALCLTQSAMFSGLNLAFFSISRLRLEAEASNGNHKAQKILEIRKDSNFLLTTILWGNVGINVLLTLLSNSVMAGLTAFAFSTVVITFAGEIIPQAYFSRRAMKMAFLLSPFIRFYQFVLYPVARPSAWMLDIWLGHEHIEFLHEHQLKRVIAQHIQASHAEVDFVEGVGAQNFLDIDDIPASQEGEPLDPKSVIELPVVVDLPVLPQPEASATDPFLAKVHASGKKWIVLTDPEQNPRLVLDADAYLRAVMLDDGPVDGYRFCHRPILVKSPRTPLGDVILDLKRDFDTASNEVIDNDIVLLWTDTEKRVITGADILGRLLHGISDRRSHESTSGN
jgi:hypothetical protein